MDRYELPAQDVGIDQVRAAAPERPTVSGPPNWRALAAVALAVAALVGVFALGRSGDPTPQAAPVMPTATAIPPTAVPTPSPTPEPPPGLFDLLGEGSVVGELDLGNRARAVVWCRESVPGTQISSTLALVHIANSLAFGDQVVSYEELTKPWIPSGSFRRGLVLQTEGLGAGNFAAPVPELSDEEIEAAEEAGTGLQCESCTPRQVNLSGTDMLVGECIHGVPLRVGIAYVVASPVRPGQTPLALHVSCGITSVRVEADAIVVSGQAPVFGASFPFPDIAFSRQGGRFVASDLGLLDWNCDVERSTQLDEQFLLRTEPTRSISYQRVESAIGEVGVHGPMVLGLNADQCSMLTRAWWGNAESDEPADTPISDLVGLAPPEGESDWFYGCDR